MNEQVCNVEAPLEFMDSMGDVVRSHRRAAGLTQQQLAELAGVGRSSVYEIEHGSDSVQLSTLLPVLKVLSITLRIEAPLLEESRDEAGEGRS